MSLTYLQAKEKLLTDSDTDCQQFFKNNGYILELGYYELLHKNCSEARKLFLSIAENGNVVLLDPFVGWGDSRKRSGQYKTAGEVEYIYGTFQAQIAYTKN